MFGLFNSKKWNPDGKHVYVTGGSSGLGLGLVQLLARKGANISIVARNQQKLDEAIASLEALRVSPSQKFNAYSHSLSPAAEAASALELVCRPYDGEAPDAIFTCAGSSKPKFFLEMDGDELLDGMNNAYWIQAFTAHAAARLLVKQRKEGAKIVLVSSLLGYISLLGYASYTPGKHALRGLADTLYSELALYNIDVHVYMPATMLTAGFDEENKTKPAITRQIEGVDEGVTGEVAAQTLYQGVVEGRAHITGDFITSLFSASTRGATPRHNTLLEALYDMIAFIAIPVWRRSVEKQVQAHKKEHYEYLTKQGFFS